MISVNELTLKYPNNKGIFDLNFDVGQGEVLGYLGPNGAGKTTTIRCLMGFTNPDKGNASIFDMDCIKHAPKIQQRLGYIPGEIAFFDSMSGREFLDFMSKMRGTKDNKRKDELLEMFELDPIGKIRKYSKGMKQKIGIVSAFMHNPDVLILDEPTSGLDPLMQNRFIELILEEKKQGKTILMSSHIFDEVERTCDNVIIIKDGKIVEKDSVQGLKESQIKGFYITLKNPNYYQKLIDEGFEVIQMQGKAEVYIKGDSLTKFMQIVGEAGVISLESKVQTLEEIFLNFYGKEN